MINPKITKVSVVTTEIHEDGHIDGPIECIINITYENYETEKYFAFLTQKPIFKINSQKLLEKIETGDIQGKILNLEGYKFVLCSISYGIGDYLYEQATELLSQPKPMSQIAKELKNES